MAKRKRGGNRTFPKRSILWVPFDEQALLVSATTPVESGNLLTQYFSQTGEEVPIGATIGPIRGLATLRPNVGTVFDDNQAIQAVLQLLPEGGRTQTANPNNDILDSMWYGQMAATTPAAESASGVFTQMPTTMPFVTKAMRKITGNGQELIMTAISVNNADYVFRVAGNVMIRLP